MDDGNSEANGSDILPKCHCGWSLCRRYQRNFRDANNEIFDGLIEIQFSTGNLQSLIVKQAWDRYLQVGESRRKAWKDGICKYSVARHHFTEALIQTYECLKAKNAWDWNKPLSKIEAKVLLFDINNEDSCTFSGEDGYLKVPNVPEDDVKALVKNLKEAAEVSVSARTATDVPESPAPDKSQEIPNAPDQEEETPKSSKKKKKKSKKAKKKSKRDYSKSSKNQVAGEDSLEHQLMALPGTGDEGDLQERSRQEYVTMLKSTNNLKEVLNISISSGADDVSVLSTTSERKKARKASKATRKSSKSSKDQLKKSEKGKPKKSVCSEEGAPTDSVSISLCTNSTYHTDYTDYTEYSLEQEMLIDFLRAEYVEAKLAAEDTVIAAKGELAQEKSKTESALSQVCEMEMQLENSVGEWTRKLEEVEGTHAAEALESSSLEVQLAEERTTSESLQIKLAEMEEKVKASGERNPLLVNNELQQSQKLRNEWLETEAALKQELGEEKEKAESALAKLADAKKQAEELEAANAMIIEALKRQLDEQVQIASTADKSRSSLEQTLASATARADSAQRKLVVADKTIEDVKQAMQTMTTIHQSMADFRGTMQALQEKAKALEEEKLGWKTNIQEYESLIEEQRQTTSSLEIQLKEATTSAQTNDPDPKKENGEGLTIVEDSPTKPTVFSHLLNYLHAGTTSTKN
jgi:hypothetical protein